MNTYKSRIGLISVDLVTLDDLSAAAMLESSARIETLASAWEQMNSETPLAAPPAALQVRVRKINIRKKIMSDWHLGLALEFQKIYR